MAVRVAIVGAGWAGLSCAIAAAAAGAQVEVFERRAALDAAPLYLDVVPDMMRSLAKLGLAEVCVRSGFPYRGVTVTDGAGRLRREIPCIRLAEAHLPVAAGLQGHVLNEALIAAALLRGVRIHFAAELEAISFDDDRAALQVKSHGVVTADLTLLATGGGAVSRGVPFEPDQAADQLADDTTAQVTWWCGLVQRPQGLDQPRFVLAGLRGKLWLAPLNGVAAGLSLIGDDLQTLTEPTLSSSQARAWLQACGCSADLVSLMSDDGPSLRPVRVRVGMRPLPWHRSNLLRVGAAAHGLPPHFSQPAAQAFEDAVVLGELLGTLKDVPELLRAFVYRRQPRVRAVFDVAARAMQWERHPNCGIGLNELAASMAAVVAAPA